MMENTVFRPLDRSKRMTYPCKKKPATNLQNGRAGKSSRSFPKKAFPVLRNRTAYGRRSLHWRHCSFWLQACPERPLEQKEPSCLRFGNQRGRSRHGAPDLSEVCLWGIRSKTDLADSEKKLKEIEEQNQKAERNCSDLFTWASTYKGASFERRQAILKQFIKEVRVGRDYNIEIVLNVPLDEFEEFKRHAASAGRGKNQKNKSQNPQKVGRCTSNAGIVVLDKTAGETISIVPKNAAHAILRC